MADEFDEAIAKNIRSTIHTLNNQLAGAAQQGIEVRLETDYQRLQSFDARVDLCIVTARISKNL